MCKSSSVKNMVGIFLLAALPQIAVCQSESIQDSVVQKSIFDLFPQDETPVLTITADFDSLKANIRNKAYVGGLFEVVHNRKSTTQVRVRLRPRGKSRRMMCDFPPLKLKFEKESLRVNGLEPFNDFKLVTHCLEDDPAATAIIKKEYLIYKLFNLMTPYSFRVSLVRITYKNTGTSFNKTTQLGIIIEDAERLASRNNCHAMEQKVISLDSLHRNQEKIASVFQYMIGNADWSYFMGRNIELIQQKDGQIIPVPYDFDYAGLVKAHYARANATLGQKTVLDRVFLGTAGTHEEMKAIFSYFRTKKADLMETIDDFDELDNYTKNEMKAYLEGFYEIIESRERVDIEMLNRKKKE